MYSAFILLISPILIVDNLILSLRRRGGLRFIKERLGLFRGRANSDKKTLWFHAASVGEVLAIIPLIQSMIKRFPEHRMVVTTNTPESAKILHSRMGNKIQHYYFTIDFPFASKRKLAQIQPEALIIAETEIWPNLYRHCVNANIPIIIVNGRIGEKTLNSKGLLRRLYFQTLAGVTQVLARSDKDAKRYIELGAAANRVRTLGNIKFANIRQEPAPALADLVNRKYILAISTHEGEEEILTGLYTTLKLEQLLVIVPRHINRSKEIEKKLKASSLSYCIRSRGEKPGPKTQVYLADTLGEINSLLTGSGEIVIVGGSLVPIGGHNVLEPAAHGKAIIMGPSIENFEEEVKLLQNQDAIAVTTNISEFKETLMQLLNNPIAAKTMGENAKKAVARCDNVLAQYESTVADIVSKTHIARNT